MGASTDTRTLKDEDRKGIVEKWDSAVEASQYEDGHSYSGCIGMLDGSPQFKDLNLESGDEAEEYIEENHDKYDSPMAVSFTKDNQKYWVIGGWCSS